MKKFITENWKKILIYIGITIAFFILVYKISAPKTIIDDYIKYGKVIEKTSGDINLDFVEEGRLFGNVNPELIKITGILIIGITIVVILTTIANKASEKKDAKKK